MHQIDSPSAVPAMPAPLAPGTPGYFAHGSPGGAPYTILTSDWANAMQMEICNVITGAGIALSKTNQSQLLAAINSIVGEGGGGGGGGGSTDSFTFAFKQLIPAGTTLGTIYNFTVPAAQMPLGDFDWCIEYDPRGTPFAANTVLALNGQEGYTAGVASTVQCRCEVYTDWGDNTGPGWKNVGTAGLAGLGQRKSATSFVASNLDAQPDGCYNRAMTHSAGNNLLIRLVVSGVQSLTGDTTISFSFGGHLVSGTATSGGGGSGGGGGGSDRIKLTAPLDMYVATSGNDTNNGLTPGTPFRTLQKPIDVIYANYDLAGQTVVVHVGNGTYTTGVSHSRPLTGVISYVGNTTTPTSCKVALAAPGACFASMYGSILSVSGFALESTAVESGVPYWLNRGMGLMSSWHGSILFDRIAFGPVTYAHMTTGSASFISVSGNQTPYSIYGSAQGHMISGPASSIHVTTSLVTISNDVNFSWFAWANQGAIIAPSVTYFGGHTVNGQRYLADSGGYIVINGGGGSYFPGNSAGSAVTGYYT